MTQRTVRRLNLAIFLLSLITIGGVVCYFAATPSLRHSFDATLTRAYSLSPQTRDLLRDLDEHWTVAVILSRETLDGADRRQIEQVLNRYTATTDQINVTWIDPLDPASLPEYDAMQQQLRDIYSDQIEPFDTLLDRGGEEVDEIIIFAQQQAGLMRRLLERLPADHAAAQPLQQQLTQLSMLSEYDSIMTEVRKAREIRHDQPFADREAARSILAAALDAAAEQLYQTALVYEELAGDSEIATNLQQFATTAVPLFEDQALQAATVSDDLKQLPEMELSLIGRRLGEGEGVVIIGRDRAAVIPRDHLMPPITRRGRATFDRRFRGEQLISSTIRSLRVDQMPVVVFMHAEEQSMFRARDRHADLLAAASLLRLNRFDVREWMLGADEDPPDTAGRNAVYIVVPPTSRETLQPTRAEMQLIDEAQTLLRSGEPVMINLHPSLMPKFNQPDPWQGLTAQLGVTADTGSVLFERFQVSGEQPQVIKDQVVTRFEDDHPICRAVHGQRTYFTLPVPLSIDTDAFPGSATRLVEIAATAGRWLEPDWALPDDRRAIPEDSQAMLSDPVTLALAITRSNPAGGGSQRCIVIGSGSWLLSYVADATESTSSGRAVLSNPGNHELLAASAAWLAGMDELIAPSPISQQIARLDGITDSVWMMWFALAALGVPIMCLISGGMVLVIRSRHSTTA